MPVDGRFSVIADLSPEDLDKYEQRFWAKVDIRGPDECWPWKGSTNTKGYGQTTVAKRTRRLAHRMAWELHNGKPLGELFARHKCDNPPCVNPHHIEPGDSLLNVRDTWERGRQVGAPADNAAKTHCIMGHPFGGDNLRYAPNGQRVCRACRRYHANAKNERDRERIAAFEGLLRECEEALSVAAQEYDRAARGFEAGTTASFVRHGLARDARALGARITEALSEWEISKDYRRLMRERKASL